MYSGLTMAVMAPAVLALSFLLAPAAVEAHGWLQQPLARQFCNTNELKWAVTTSAGNGAKGMGGGGLLKLGGVPGLCGDPFEGKADEPASNFKALPCQPQEVYQAGGILRTQVDIIANHGGFWEMSVCDSEDITQACFDSNKLKTKEHNSEQWHILSTTIDEPNVRNPESYVMEWQLPEGLTCDHCVVQWSWWTATHCVYPCEKEVCGFYADRLNKIVRPTGTHPMDFCDSKSPSKNEKPQMFRNCADIKITGSGQGTSTASASASTSSSTEEPPSLVEELTTTDDAGDDGGDDDGDDGGDDSGDDGGEDGGDGDDSVASDSGVTRLNLKKQQSFVEEDDGEPEMQAADLVSTTSNTGSNGGQDSGCEAGPGYFCGPGGRIRKSKTRSRGTKDRKRKPRGRGLRLM